MFIDTIKEMRTMVNNHYGTYTKDTLGLNKKNTKVPFTHLKGRREKIHKKHQNEKNRARE